MIKEKALNELLFKQYKQLQIRIAKEAVEELKHYNIPLSQLVLLKWIEYVESN